MQERNSESLQQQQSDLAYLRLLDNYSLFNEEWNRLQPTLLSLIAILVDRKIDRYNQ